MTGNDVHVRSGPGSNYYPTTRLQSGDRMQVRGEQFGWLKIDPPPGSFSYVDMTLVRKTDDRSGLIITDNVPGSLGNIPIVFTQCVYTKSPEII